jgi:hypothetical protein
VNKKRGMKEATPNRIIIRKLITGVRRRRLTESNVKGREDRDVGSSWCEDMGKEVNDAEDKVCPAFRGQQEVTPYRDTLA